MHCIQPGKIRYKQNSIKIIDRQWTDDICVTSRLELMRESDDLRLYDNK